MKDNYNRIYIGESYEGIDWRVIEVNGHGFIERNHSTDKDDWFLITGIWKLDEAIKKAQDFVKRSYTGNYVPCPYNF